MSTAGLGEGSTEEPSLGLRVPVSVMIAVQTKLFCAWYEGGGDEDKGLEFVQRVAHRIIAQVLGASRAVPAGTEPDVIVADSGG